MKFKSQICTSKSQSEALLKLGLKKETADIVYQPYYVDGVLIDYFEPQVLHGSMREYIIQNDEDFKDYIPAWSLHRLLSILNEDDSIIDVTVKDGRYGIHSGYDTEWYDDLYDGIIAVFDELIKEGYFNKEYLV